MVSRLLCRHGTPWHLDLHPPRLAKTLWADPLGRHRDLFDLERLYRRRGPLWRARCGRDTGRAPLVSAARPRLSSKGEPSLRGKKVFHMCWPLSDGSSKFQPLDPGPEIAVLALDFLRVLLAYVMLLGSEMPLIGPPAVGVILGDAEGL